MVDKARLADYNKKLGTLKSAEGMAETRLEYGRKAVLEKCKKASEILGREITPENVRQELEAEMAKLEAALANGESIVNQVEQQLASEGAQE